MDSGTIIVGAHRADPAGTDSGAAYVYERDAGGIDSWGETRILHNGGAYDLFGCAVGISADTMVVGAYHNTDNGFMAGAAFIHERDDSGADNWGRVNELLPVAAGELPGDHFGKSVDIDVDVAVVGAYAARDSYGSNFGTAYVFERDHLGLDNWGQFKMIGAFSEGASGDQFGWSAGVSGDFVIIGAPGDDDMGSGSGSAYILDRYYDSGNDGWGYDRRKKLFASDGAAGDYFGSSVDISGGFAVVGAYQDDDMGSTSGSVYVFEKDANGANNWGEVKKLLAFDGIANDNFGFSVAASGSFIAVGANGDDDKGSSSGSVYIYERDTGGSGAWGLVKKITSPDGAASDYFGYAVSLSGPVLLVGAHGDDDKGSGSGSAYIFDKNTGGTNNWGLVKKLVALDGAASDAFGHSVSINGDRAVVGAYQDDDVASASGSAYVFLRNEGGANNWGQVDKLTAPDPVANAYFGDAVAIFEDTVLVGAHAHDEYGTDSGAAYIFSIPFDTCMGDSDSDHDVDGFDLANYIAEGAFESMDNFASSFGHINCP